MTGIHPYEITHVLHSWSPLLDQEATNLCLCCSHMVRSCPMTLLHQIYNGGDTLVRFWFILNEWCCLTKSEGYPCWESMCKLN